MKRYSRVLFGTVAIIMLLLFQNCAGSSFQTTDSSSGSSSSSSVGTNNPTGTTMPGTPTTIPTATTLPPVACPASSFGVPTMSAPSATTATVLSGQGANGGRKDSASITFSYTASNTPANCSQSVTVNCKMTSKASDITVIDQSGSRVAFSGNAGNAFVCRRAKTVLDATGSSSLLFQAGDNDTDTQCLNGTATFDLSLTSNGDTKKESAKQTITVTFKSNCLPEQIDASAADAFDQLGTAVSMDGDTVAAIAPGDDGATNSIQKLGAVYMYDRTSGNTWTMSQVVRTTDSSIVSDRGVDGDNPSAVALKGSVMVIGTEVNNSGAGAIHIFKKSGSSWSQASKIQGPVAGGKFGRSVAVSGNTILVGAPGENNSAGAVYLYDANTFAQMGRIANPLASPANTYFGNAVAIEGTLIAVGAPGSTLYRDTVSGEVFLFQTSGAEISTPFRTNAMKSNMAMKNVSGGAVTVSVALGSELGNSVAIYNGVVMVGAPGYSTGGKKVGAAFSIAADRSTIQYLTDFSGTDGVRFGTSVSMGAAGAVVGVAEARNRGGAVDVFAGSGSALTFSRRVFSHSGADSDQFGFSVSMSGNYFVSGAKLNSEPNNSSGTVSLFSLVVP